MPGYNSVFDDEMYAEDREDQDSERAYNAPVSGLNFNYNTISVFVNPTKKGEPAVISLDFPFSFVKISGTVNTASATNISWDKKGKGDHSLNPLCSGLWTRDSIEIHWKISLVIVFLHIKSV